MRKQPGTTAGRQAKGVREGLSAAAAAKLSDYNTVERKWRQWGLTGHREQ